jgi:hypothetical protein
MVSNSGHVGADSRVWTDVLRTPVPTEVEDDFQSVYSEPGIFDIRCLLVDARNSELHSGWLLEWHAENPSGGATANSPPPSDIARSTAERCTRSPRGTSFGRYPMRVTTGGEGVSASAPTVTSGSADFAKIGTVLFNLRRGDRKPIPIAGNPRF